MMRIEKAAVLGAGTMGAQIAAHLANAGVPTLLLDIPPAQLLPEEEARGLTLQSKEVRNRIARAGFEAAKKAKPAAFFTPAQSALVASSQAVPALVHPRTIEEMTEIAAEEMAKEAASEGL